MCRTNLSALLIAMVFAGLLSACAPPEEEPEPMEEPEVPETLGLGVDLDNMDRSVRPQDDFFEYMNGGWLAATEIPPDRSRWGSFDELREEAEEQVLELVTDMANTPGHVPGSEEQKVADMFLSFMGEASIEASGLAPLENELAAIDSIQSHEDLAAHWSQAVAQRITAPISYGVVQDPGQSDRYVTTITQSGLGMPDREYYLSGEERFQRLREQYRAHVSNMLSLAGMEDTEEAAERIMAIETRIAESHWTRAENRDRIATYNLMLVDELIEEAPEFSWRRFLDVAGLASAAELVVRQPDYMTEVADFYQDFPVEDWQEYQRFHLLSNAAPYLPAEFVEEDFDFHGRALRGQPEMRPREKRGLEAVESTLGFLVGRMYVDDHFLPEAGERMDEMVDNLLAAFENSLDELDWMGEETRAEARTKLANLNTKIGHPEEWRDYECVNIAADDLIGNVRRADECEWERQRGRLGEPVDRDEWFMTPQTVNAYYSSANNEIVFPAAILQPPFFNVAADEAVNYGAIGAVIGHEISHAFDDQGRRSDGEGNLRDWWTREDEERFNERANRVVNQYSDYEPLPGMNIQGELALGENIADISGLAVAYRAYRRSLDGEDPRVIDGFTGDQRFFMGWGQVWRTKYRDEALERQLVTGPHSPGRYRVIGVLSNISEFYEAFDVSEGDDMFLPPEQRVSIW